MSVVRSAGDFEIRSYPEGYPSWTTLYYKGDQVCMFSHTELRDLEYIVSTIRADLRREMPSPYGEEP